MYDRDQLTEALGHLSFTAQRDFPRVGNTLLATPWDLHHRQIDDMLTLWELAAQSLETECA